MHSTLNIKIYDRTGNTCKKMLVRYWDETNTCYVFVLYGIDPHTCKISTLGATKTMNKSLNRLKQDHCNYIWNHDQLFRVRKKILIQIPEEILFNIKNQTYFCLL